MSVISKDFKNKILDYKMSRLNENITKFINDYDYYKTKNSFIYTIENIERKLGKSEELKTLIENFLNNLNNLEDEFKEEEINKILESFMYKNAKKYLRRMSSTDWDAYEYEHEWKLYIKNRKINVVEVLDFIFPNLEIKEIKIDNMVRTSPISTLLDEMKVSKTEISLYKKL